MCTKEKSKYSYILVVVDMQPDFSASKDRTTVSNISRQIARARSFNQPIILVEYGGFGETIPKIKQLLDDYGNMLYVLEKSSDDGSYEIEMCLIDAWIETEKFLVCGVNTEACVRATAEGLSKRFSDSKVMVLGSACNSDIGNLMAIKIIKKHQSKFANLVVVA